MRRRGRMSAWGCLLALMATSLAHAEAAGSPLRGGRLLRENCARCHTVGRSGQSANPLAPPFRELHKRYDVQTLEEALAEGIMTGHRAMPQFRFDPGQIADAIAYLKTLEPARSRP